VYLTPQRRDVLNNMRHTIRAASAKGRNLQMNFVGIGGVGKSHVLMLFAHLFRKQADSNNCVVYVHNC